MGSPPCITAATEFVVPRSIPMIFPMYASSVMISYAPAQDAHCEGCT